MNTTLNTAEELVGNTRTALDAFTAAPRDGAALTALAASLTGLAMHATVPDGPGSGPAGRWHDAYWTALGAQASVKAVRDAYPVSSLMERVVASVTEAVAAFERASDVLETAFRPPASWQDLLEQAKTLPAAQKVELITAMGFSPMGSDHTRDCPYVWDSGLRCNCVPEATVWTQPCDVDALRGETYEERRELALNGPPRITPAVER